MALDSKLRPSFLLIIARRIFTVAVLIQSYHIFANPHAELSKTADMDHMRRHRRHALPCRAMRPVLYCLAVVYLLVSMFTLYQ